MVGIGSGVGSGHLITVRMPDKGWREGGMKGWMEGWMVDRWMDG